MGSTTFGYDQSEDRVWMSFNDDTPRLWLTRRLLTHLLGPMLHPFEEAAPGAQGGASPAVRAELEHQLAINERMPGEQDVPMRIGLASAADACNAEHLLCTGLTASFDASHCRLEFATPEGPRVVQTGRVGMHRWLRGLHLVAQHAGWAVPTPAWLSQSRLPDAVRALVDGVVRPNASGPPSAI